MKETIIYDSIPLLEKKLTQSLNNLIIAQKKSMAPILSSYFHQQYKIDYLINVHLEDQANNHDKKIRPYYMYKYSYSCYSNLHDIHILFNICQ